MAVENFRPDGWLVWAPVPFGLGVGLYFAAPFEPERLPILLAASAVALLATIGRRWPQLRFALIVLLLVLLGGLAAKVSADSKGTVLLERRLPPQELEGRIETLELRDGHFRILLADPLIEDLSGTETPKRVRVRVSSGGEVLKPGQRVRMLAILLPPSRPLAPGGFDFARRSYFQGIGGVGFALGAPEVLSAPRDVGPAARWREFWNGLRLAIAERILSIAPGQAGAVAVALTTGQRGALTERTQEDMRDSGLAHLLAISGLHLGLVAATVIFFLRFCLAAVQPLALRFPTKKIAAVLGMLAAFGYLFLAGATIPALRAFIMVAIALLAVLIQRNPFSLRLVAVAALAILAAAPESLLSPSFQLSFAAVTALVAFFRAKPFDARDSAREEGLATVPRFLRYFLILGLTSAIAIAATTPFALHHFGRFAPYGLFANLVAVPLVGFAIMPCALLTALLWPFGLEGIGITVMVWLIDLLLLLAQEVAALPAARLVLPSLPLWGLLFCLAGGLFGLLTRGRLRWPAAPLLLCGLLSLYLKPQPDILVDETSRLMAVRGEGGGYYFNSMRRESFTREIWLEHLGEVRGRPWRVEAVRDRMRCDGEACIYRVGERQVTLSFTAAAAAEDCALSDMVISREPLHRIECGAPDGFYDRRFFRREGASFFYIDESGVRVETASQLQGNRPWSQVR